MVSLLTDSFVVIMPYLMLKDLPRYECLLVAAQQFPELDPSACEVFLNLLRTGDQAFHVTESNLQRHGISQGRFTILMFLLDKSNGCPQPRTPAELAEMSGVTRATITGLLDTLERDELIIRQPDPEDRRMMSVRLTEKGIAFITGILPSHFSEMASLMRALSEPERKTLVALLVKISVQASAHEAGAAEAAAGVAHY
jgi:DNA-binding MarR family transcriptional regulator